jgi:hypothetical protein
LQKASALTRLKPVIATKTPSLQGPQRANHNTYNHFV